MTAGITTRSAIRDQIRLRSDTVNSQFVTDTELNGYIQASYFELYDLLVQKYGDDYVVKTSQFTTDGTNDQYALPEDFYKLRGVDYVESDDTRATLRPFSLGERNRFAQPNTHYFYGATEVRYRVNGSKLWLRPMPDPDLTFEIIYTPRLATLTADEDTVDGVSGWEEYIVVDCAIKVLQKEESDPSAFMAQKAALVKRIEDAASNRDAGSPATVTDTSAARWGFGPSWPGGE